MAQFAITYILIFIPFTCLLIGMLEYTGYDGYSFRVLTGSFRSTALTANERNVYIKRPASIRNSGQPLELHNTMLLEINEEMKLVDMERLFHE